MFDDVTEARVFVIDFGMHFVPALRQEICAFERALCQCRAVCIMKAMKAMKAGGPMTATAALGAIAERQAPRARM